MVAGDHGRAAPRPPRRATAPTPRHILPIPRHATSVPRALFPARPQKHRSGHRAWTGRPPPFARPDTRSTAFRRPIAGLAGRNSRARPAGPMAPMEGGQRAPNHARSAAPIAAGPHAGRRRYPTGMDPATDRYRPYLPRAAMTGRRQRHRPRTGLSEKSPPQAGITAEVAPGVQPPERPDSIGKPLLAGGQPPSQAAPDAAEPTQPATLGTPWDRVNFTGTVRFPLPDKRPPSSAGPDRSASRFDRGVPARARVHTGHHR